MTKQELCRQLLEQHAEVERFYLENSKLHSQDGVIVIYDDEYLDKEDLSDVGILFVPASVFCTVLDKFGVPHERYFPTSGAINLFIWGDPGSALRINESATCSLQWPFPDVLRFSLNKN